MGLFDGVMGNASKIDAAKIQDEFSRILAPGEVVEHAYQLNRLLTSPTSALRPGARLTWMPSSRSGFRALPHRFRSSSTRSSAFTTCRRCWPVMC